MTTAKRGRPSGLLLNYDAVADLLGDNTQSWLADQVGITPAKLSSLLTGSHGVSDKVAVKLAEALGCRLGTICPERVGYSAPVRVFVWNGVEEREKSS